MATKQLTNEQALEIAKEYNTALQAAEKFNDTEKRKCYARMERYIVVAEAGKVRIQDTIEWDRKWDEAQAAKYFGNVKIIEKSVKINKDNEVITKTESHLFYYQWMSVTKRFDKIIFDPTKPRGPLEEVTGTWVYNRWSGFAYQPDSTVKCNLFYDYLLNRICDNKKEAYEYVLDWMASIFQRPEKKNFISLVFSSREQGSGKSVLGGILIELLKPYSMEVGLEDLIGRFNEHLRNKLFMYIDENAFFQKRTVWNTLKKMITSSVQNIEEKNMSLLVAENYLRLMFSSNDEISVGLESSNRRYVTIKCKEEKMPKAERDAMVAQLEAGGYNRIMFDMMYRDIENKDWTPPIFDSSYLNNTLETLKTTNPSWIWLVHCAFDDIVKEQSCFNEKLISPSGAVYYRTREGYHPLVSDLYAKYVDWSKSSGMFTIQDQHKFYMDLGHVLEASTDHKGGRKRDCSPSTIPGTKERLAKCILGSKDHVHWLGEYTELDKEVQKKKLRHDEVIDRLKVDLSDNVAQWHIDRLKEMINDIEDYIDVLEEKKLIQEEVERLRIEQEEKEKNMMESFEKEVFDKAECKRLAEERELFLKEKNAELERRRKRVDEIMERLDYKNKGRQDMVKGALIRKDAEKDRQAVLERLASLRDRQDALDGQKGKDGPSEAQDDNIINNRPDPSGSSIEDDAFYQQLISTQSKGSNEKV